MSDEIIKNSPDIKDMEVATVDVDDTKEIVVDNDNTQAIVLDNDNTTSNEVANNSKRGKARRFFGNEIIKCTLVLVAIAVVAGALLGVLNWVTYVDPDGAIMEKVSAYYGVTLESVVKSEDLANYDNINAVFTASDDSGVVGYCYYSVGTGAKDGTLELLVYIDKDGIIKEIAVYAQGETAGYFAKVEKANKAKYIGIDVDEIDGLTLVKGDGDIQNGVIDSVSQATYTSRGYHNAIAVAVNAYKLAKEGAKI